VNGKRSVTNADGVNLIRDLPQGRIDLSVTSDDGIRKSEFSTTLTPGPVTRRGFDLRIDHR
jgi:hypothetical protein